MEWKQVKGFASYEVSDSGLVKSRGHLVKRGSGTYQQPEKILSPKKDKDGYLEVNLYKNGKAHTSKVHILIASAFVEKVAGKPFVNHKNGVKQDCNKSNLEWCTKKENHEHAVLSKLKVLKADKPVFQYDKAGLLVNTFSSGIEAARQLKISHGNISRAANGHLKTYKGFVWGFQ